MSSASESGSVFSESEPFQSGQRQPPVSSSRARETSTESDGPSITPNSRRHPKSNHQQSHINGEPLKSISTRPNKYRGPPSTWRNRNAPERDLAASLDQITAQDLSIHVFNAHKLKQSGLQQRADGVDSQDPFAFTWTPPKNWTAWPMPPEAVPREGGEAYGRKLIRMPYPYLPKPVRRAGLLQDLLLAQMLREAKVRLGQREKVREPTHEPQTLKPLEQSTQGVSDNDGQTSTVWEGSDSDGAATGGRRRKRPKMTEAAAQTANLGHKQLKPVMLADDSTAIDIARPLIQSVCSQLDTLLGNLHRARQSYHSIETNDRTTSQSRSTKRDRGRSSTPAPRRSTTHDPLSSGGEDSSTNVNQTPAHGHRQSSQSKRFQMRKKRLNLRDWNDVIGLASTSGVSQEVIEMSRQRCGALLGMHGRKGIGLKSDETTSGEDESDSNRSHSGTSEVGSKVEPSAKHSQVASNVSSDNLFQPIKGKRSWRHQIRKR